MTRPPTTRAVRRGVVLAVGAVLLVAGPAGAHPFFEGGEAPVDSLSTLTLAMAHGCESEDDGDGDPTTDVSVEVPDWMRIVDVPDVEGWTVELEEGDDGATEVVTWAADGGEEPAPTFDLDVVAEGEVGAERYVSVFQGCDDVTYRWVGTPDDPADDPAISLTLIEADLDSPAPPQEDPVDSGEDPDDPTDEDPDDPTDGDTGPADEPTSSEDDAEDAEGSESDAPEDTDTDDEAADDEAADDETADEELASDDLAAEDDEGGATGWFVAVLAVLLVGGIVVWFMARRGRDTEGA